MRWAGAMLLAALVAAPVAAAAAVRVGDAAPAVALTDAAGAMTGLERFRGRVVILDFTASWCVACRSALPVLDALGRRWAERGVTVVTVAIDAARRDADRFLGEVVPERAMTVLYDPAGTALARFGAGGMPAHYVLDRAGIVRYAASGWDQRRGDGLEAAVRLTVEAAGGAADGTGDAPAPGNAGTPAPTP